MLKIINKKLLLGLGAIATTSLVAITVIACSPGSVDNKKIETLAKITLKSDETLQTAIGEKKFADLGKIVLITDEGSVNDKSFNQSSWEAVQVFAKQVGDLTKESAAENITSLVPTGSSRENYFSSYNAALQKGFKYWVLPGFKHASHIKAYWKQNATAIEKAGVVIVGIDFDPNEPDQAPANETEAAKTIRLGTIVNSKNSVSLQFKTHESGFIVGYAAAKYLGENDTNKLLTSFGGGVFPGVTNFNRGFLAGAKLYNDEAEKSKRVKMAGTSVDLTSTFTVGSDPMKASVNKAVTSNAKIILPVAGPATGAVLTQITPRSEKQLVIGVDVNQAVSTPASASKFFSSIEKRISQAIYETLFGLFDNSTKLGDKALVHYKGFVEGWVGYSPSTIEPAAEATKANAALAAAETYFKLAANKSKIDAEIKTDAAFNSAIQANLDALLKAINDKANEAAVPAASSNSGTTVAN